MKVSTTVKIGEVLFETSLQYFQSDRKKLIRARGKVSLPAGIASIVDIITGLDDFPLNQVQRNRNSFKQESRDGYIEVANVYIFII